MIPLRCRLLPKSLALFSSVKVTHSFKLAIRKLDESSHVYLRYGEKERRIKKEVGANTGRTKDQFAKAWASFRCERRGGKRIIS